MYGIFKMSPIHASMIIMFPKFIEFSESYAPFRKTPIIWHTDSKSVYISVMTLDYL